MKVAVIYHGACRDGRAGAYAAWKHFGADAEYIASYYGTDSHPNLAGREVYVIDYCYKKEDILTVEAETKLLVVLDHHASAKESMELIRNKVFDINHSGSVIAWNYFHPDTVVPKLLQYIEDYDLWRYALPYSRDIEHYLDALEFEDGTGFDFSKFDKFVDDFDNPEKFEKMKLEGSYYRKYIDSVITKRITLADKVTFEGHVVLAVEGGLFNSHLGEALAKTHPPFAIVWSRYRGLWHFSLRGVGGQVDLSQLAKKYGGGGHLNSAGFTLPFSAPFPFKFT